MNLLNGIILGDPARILAITKAKVDLCDYLGRPGLYYIYRDFKCCCFRTRANTFAFRCGCPTHGTSSQVYPSLCDSKAKCMPTERDIGHSSCKTSCFVPRMTALGSLIFRTLNPGRMRIIFSFVGVWQDSIKNRRYL